MKCARYMSIPWTAPTAATSVGEKHDASRPLSRNGKITVQHDASLRLRVVS